MNYISQIKINMKMWKLNRVKKALALAEEKVKTLTARKCELEEALKEDQIKLALKSFYPHTLNNKVFK